MQSHIRKVYVVVYNCTGCESSCTGSGSSCTDGGLVAQTGLVAQRGLVAQAGASCGG